MTSLGGYLRSRIARKLVLAFLVLSSVITMVTTGIKLYLDYNNGLEHIDNFLTQIERSYLPILKNSLWDFDDQQVETGLKGILAIPGVEQAEIISEKQNSHSYGKRTSTHIVEKRLPLYVTHQHKTVSLGELKIIHSLDRLYSELYKSALYTMVSYGLLTLFISACILILVHHLVTHRLFSLTSLIQHTDIEKLGSVSDFPELARLEEENLDEFEEILHAIIFMRTRLTKTFEELEKSKNRYHRLFEQSPVALWEEDFTEVVSELNKIKIETAEGWRQYFSKHPSEVLRFAQLVKVIDINNAALKLHKATSKEELIGNLDKIFTEKSLEAFQEELVALGINIPELSLQGEVASLDGETKVISLKISFDRQEEKRILALLSTEDITERIKKEQENQILISALQNVAESVIVTDAHGLIIYVNPSFERISGYTSNEVLGNPPSILSSGVQDARFYESMWKTLVNGKIWQGQLCNRKKDGSLFYEEVSISPVTATDGTVLNYVSVKRDITDEREAEKHLLQTQKVEAIGNLAGGIAHDFNNILSSILGFSEIVLDEIDNDSHIYNDIQEIRNAALRAKNLVQQILLFARKADDEIKPIKIEPVISEVVSFLESTIPSTISIETHLESNATIFGNTTQVHQVMMNLCTNAVQAIGNEVGKITISLGVSYIEDGEIKQLRAGDYLTITVSDSGKGIPSHHMDSIFEPYFTTKGAGDGTGLGLSVVHGIINSYKGAITVNSQPDTGTIFTLYFPVIKDRETQNDVSVTDPQGGNERILFVDDEQAIVKMAGKMLNSLGYRVTTLTDSTSALELFSSSPSSFDLLISDMTMPRMTGDDLALQCMEIKPDLPVILCTGYTTKISSDEAAGKGIRAFITKPVTKTELANAIRKVLDPKRA